MAIIDITYPGIIEVTPQTVYVANSYKGELGRRTIGLSFNQAKVGPRHLLVNSSIGNTRSDFRVFMASGKGNPVSRHTKESTLLESKLKEHRHPAQPGDVPLLRGLFGPHIALLYTEPTCRIDLEGRAYPYSYLRLVGGILRILE